MTFSIVTPSFRQPEWLRLCLRSVADQMTSAAGAGDQSGDDAPVIVDHVVQDACSGEAVRGVCAEFPNVRLFQEHDGGMYDAVNRGWRRGTGDICAYLNCDEQYLPGTLTAVEAYFQQHPDVDLLFGDVIVVDATGQYICSRRVLTPLKHHTQVCQLNTFTAAMFFRRRLLEDPTGFFDTKWRNYGDAVWVLKMIERGVKMAVLRQYLSVFTDTGANMNLNEEGRREFDNLRLAAAPWVRALAPLWVAHHRVRRLVHGLYERSPLEYCIYTSAAPKKRACFEVEKSTPIWRDRLAWTR